MPTELRLGKSDPVRTPPPSSERLITDFVSIETCCRHIRDDGIRGLPRREQLGCLNRQSEVEVTFDECAGESQPGNRKVLRSRNPVSR